MKKLRPHPGSCACTYVYKGFLFPPFSSSIQPSAADVRIRRLPSFTRPFLWTFGWCVETLKCNCQKSGIWLSLNLILYFTNLDRIMYTVRVQTYLSILFSQARSFSFFFLPPSLLWFEAVRGRVLEATASARQRWFDPPPPPASLYVASLRLLPRSRRSSLGCLSEICF